MRSSSVWRRPHESRTESRLPSSGAASARHDANGHESDATPLEVQAPVSTVHFRGTQPHDVKGR